MKKKFSLFAMCLLYIVAGINHFIHPAFYIDIMPPYFPKPAFWVAISGVCEILFGLLLLFQKTRAFASWAIVQMLIVFLTVHIQMVMDNTNPRTLIFWISWLRLPLQYILIRWAYKMRRVKIVYNSNHS
jgi:uncharacterized membrane protein